MKKKIVHLQVLPILSGVQKITLNIYKNLDPAQYEMYLICAKSMPEQDSALITEVRSLGVKIIELEELKRQIGFHDILVFFKLLKIFRKYKFDIIHTHSSKTGFLGRIAGKLSGCKKVIHTVHGISFHDYEHPVKKFAYYGLEILAGFFNDKVILVNKFYRSQFWFIPAKKIMTIYNGIDFDDLLYRKDRDDNKVKLISVGRLDKQKSPLDLLEAFAKVCRKRDNIELNIVGDGEYYNILIEFILQHDLKDKVNLLGWRLNL